LVQGVSIAAGNLFASSGIGAQYTRRRGNDLPLRPYTQLLATTRKRHRVGSRRNRKGSSARPYAGAHACAPV